MHNLREPSGDGHERGHHDEQRTDRAKITRSHSRATEVLLLHLPDCAVDRLVIRDGNSDA